jgi:hypothetical protein
LLVENAFNFAEHGAAGLDALATVVHGADCYRLVVGALDVACETLVKEVLAVGR